MVFLIFLASVPVAWVALWASDAVMIRVGETATFGLKLGLLFLLLCTALWLECTPWSLLASAMAVLLAYRIHAKSHLDQLSGLLGRYRLPMYLLSLLGMAMLVLVAIPITTFLTSPGEIGIHLERLLRVNARDAMVIVYIGVILYSVVNSSGLRSAMTVLSVGAFFLCWLYALVLPFGYPMLSGLAFEQLPLPLSTVAVRVLSDVSVVVGVGLALRLAWRRFGTAPLMAVLVIANVSIAVTAAVSAHQDPVGAAGGSDTTSPAQRPLRFSRSQPNTLFIFLDRFMGSYVESILESDPDVASRLSGFTWYPATISAGENSIAGVHPMLGGYDYTPTEMNDRRKLLRDLSVEAFSILPYNFASKGYRVSIVNPRGLGFTMLGDCSFMSMKGVSCTHTPASISLSKAKAMGFPINDLAEANYADLLTLLGSMRVAPYTMKEAVYVKGPWRPFLDHSAATTFREWAELEALNQLTEVDNADPAFNFIANILPHEPYFMGQDCLPQAQRATLSDNQLARLGHKSLFSWQHANAARCALLSVTRYMDHLKAHGVYDNTTIVIASDHGIVGAVEDDSRRAIAGGATSNAYVSLRPLVLFKPAGGTGPVAVSETFMPNAEVPRLLCMDIGGCVNPYLDMRPIEALGRDNPFVASLVPWQFSLQKPDAFVIKKQIILRDKSPFGATNWSIEHR